MRIILRRRFSWMNDSIWQYKIRPFLTAFAIGVLYLFGLCRQRGKRKVGISIHRLFVPISKVFFDVRLYRNGKHYLYLMPPDSR